MQAAMGEGVHENWTLRGAAMGGSWVFYLRMSPPNVDSFHIDSQCCFNIRQLGGLWDMGFVPVVWFGLWV